MAFPDTLKEEVKRRAHFKCCLCHERWATHVHHIMPESQNGPDTEDNAAPLCATCHDLYGDNPQKRRFIKQSRDFWYDLCDRRFPPDSEMINEVVEKFRAFVATKEDLQTVVSYFDDKIQNIMSQPLSTEEQLLRISDATNAFSVTTTSASITTFGSGWQQTKYTCERCGASFVWNFEKCPRCGHPK